MKVDPATAAKALAKGSNNPDRRAWARNIMIKVKGGLRVPIAVREMAERALMAPKEEE